MARTPQSAPPETPLVALFYWRSTLPRRPAHRESQPRPQTDRSQLPARSLAPKLLPQALEATLRRRIFQSARAISRSHTPSFPEKPAARHLPSPNPGRPQVRQNSSMAGLLLAQLFLALRPAVSLPAWTHRGSAECDSLHSRLPLRQSQWMSLPATNRASHPQLLAPPQVLAYARYPPR